MYRLAQTAFLLMLFSLAFMKPNVPIGGLLATPTDLLFLLASAALAVAVASGRAKLRWNPFYLVLLVYFAAMAVSALLSDDPRLSWFKLATQAYLLSLPVLCDNLIGSRDDLRMAIRTWLAASAVPAVVGSIAVLAFAVGLEGSLVDWARHHFGTLPPGNYTRIEATFRHPAMLCSYLTVSLVIALAAERAGWLGRAPFWILLAAIVVAACFTLTPGLGGIFLALGIWGYLRLRGRRGDILALGSLGLGVILSLLFVAAAAVTPILHPTAPYLIEIPGIAVQFAPSVRLMTWTDAWHTWLANPWFGSGVGTEAAAAHYVDPSGIDHRLGDAHNVFLNVAAGSGIVGLAALLLVIAGVARLTGRPRFDGVGAIRFSLGFAWLVAFVYEGLTGSYEDARHLWVVVGLLLASARLEAKEGTALATTSRAA
ncbi:MAG TPA: O-antigen ligase family protein [Sphingomicrobium sp.]|nr:O-antigen ligase family protein [Sphingomicrobium sp.]